MKKKTVALIVTGGIAAYKACEVLRLLKKEGAEVVVVMTKNAEEFVTPLSFAALSGRKVHRSLFGDADSWSVEHVALADEADLILIAPATADIISKISSGICDDLPTCLVAAFRKKVLIAPAMNEAMYENKIIQENISRLKKLGYLFVGPKKGELACHAYRQAGGTPRIGCLEDPEAIVAEVKKIL